MLLLKKKGGGGLYDHFIHDVFIFLSKRKKVTINEGTTHPSSHLNPKVKYPVHLSYTPPFFITRGPWGPVNAIKKTILIFWKKKVPTVRISSRKSNELE